MTEKVYKVRTPLFPTYGEVRALMPIFAGMKKADVTSFIKAIFAQTGTPKNPVDWSEPDKWIPERLKGADAEHAKRIWVETHHHVNPRHVYGSYLFINSFDLLSVDANGNYALSDLGRAFLKDEAGAVRELDEAEGVARLLTILSTKDKVQRRDLLPEWSEYLLEHSKFQKPSTHKDTLRRRLANLVERGLVDREGNSYRLNAAGLQYAESIVPASADPKREVLKAVKSFNDQQRVGLKATLAELHPYKFEHLVRDLLEAMGYEDVTVTKEAGDKGVDVIANIQFGITSVREVVQVKRTPNSSLGRPIVDQLRGALPYHQAIRGTIITLGTVSKGAREAAIFPGAAPITLIDGEKLLDMLVEHEVAIKKRPVAMWEVDQDFFVDNDEPGLVEVE